MDVKKIALFLAQLRKERSLTQAELGEIIGVTNKTISRWENGNYLPPVEMLMELSRFYGVSINEILSGQRLDDTEYKAHAEENMKAALAQSSFSVGEKMAYFSRKWDREHRWETVLAVCVAVMLLLAGIWYNNGLQITAILWIAGFLVVHNNRKLAYMKDLFAGGEKTTGGTDNHGSI